MLFDPIVLYSQEGLREWWRVVDLLFSFQLCFFLCLSRSPCPVVVGWCVLGCFCWLASLLCVTIGTNGVLVDFLSVFSLSRSLLPSRPTSLASRTSGTVKRRGRERGRRGGRGGRVLSSLIDSVSSLFRFQLLVRAASYGTPHPRGYILARNIIESNNGKKQKKILARKCEGVNSWLWLLVADFVGMVSVVFGW